MVTAKILAKNNNRPGNIEIIDFLKKHIELLISKDIIFEFVIVNDDQIENLIENGITKLPACVIKDTKLLGPTQIKSFFTKNYVTKAGKSKSISSSPEEDLRTWQENEMTMEDEDSEDENVMRDVMSKAEEMMENRRQTFEDHQKPPAQKRPVAKRTNNILSSGDDSGNNSSDIIKAASETRNKDDLLIASMFEETDF